jgi:hypothetical protein
MPGRLPVGRVPTSLGDRFDDELINTLRARADACAASLRSEAARRAYVIASAPTSTKRETPPLPGDEVSVPIPVPASPGVEDGRFPECA